MCEEKYVKFLKSRWRCDHIGEFKLNPRFNLRFILNPRVPLIGFGK